MISILQKANGDIQTVFSVTSVSRTLDLFPEVTAIHSEGTIRRNAGYAMRLDAHRLSSAQARVIGDGSAIVFAGGRAA